MFKIPNIAKPGRGAGDRGDIFRRLAKHLDRLPGGYPATKSGVELRILKRLFTPKEAELALKLNLIAEEPLVIARRAKINEDEAARRLEEMALKGLIYRTVRRKSPPRFMALQFVIGIWEFHVNSLDPELIKDFNEYMPDLFNLESWKKSPQLRTVPVGRSIDVELKALPYEDVWKLVESQSKFLEAPCICRRERRIMGEGCDKPEGNCLVFGGGVDYYKRNGMGREISKQEALELIKKADKEGLVLQPSFSKKIANICCCCGCCCQVLKTIKRHPRPADMVSSPFIAEFKEESCSGCGICVERCQMAALSLDGDKVVLDATQCIGCGLCVTTCPTDSLYLVRKPEEEQIEIPDNMVKAYIQRTISRGWFFGRFRLLRMVISSKLGRFLVCRKKAY